MPKPKFPLGALVWTPGAMRAFEAAYSTEESRDGARTAATELLQRHASGDWGEVGEGDRRENEYSLDKHLRLMSVYIIQSGVKVWIITEADRSVTTILLPEGAL
jgi:hypothetical protein